MPRTKIVLVIISLLAIAVFTPQALIVRGSSPTFQLTKTWGGASGNSTGRAVAVDASGNTYVTGITSSFGPRSPSTTAIIVLKYARDGILDWQRLWSNSTDASTGIAVDSAGGVYVTGTISGPDAFSPQSGLLFKLDSTGNLLWQKTWSYGMYTDANAVAIDSSNNIYVTGSTQCPNYSCFNTVFLIKFDTSGNLLWQQAWNAGIGNGEGVAVDPLGNVYVTGLEDAYQAGGGTAWQLMVLKFNPSGSLVWQRIHGGTGNEFGTAIAVDSTGNVYVTGASQGNGTRSNFHLILLKLDSTGNLLAQRTWGGNDQDWGSGIVVDSSGSISITGYTNSYGAKGNCSPPAGRLLGNTTCYNLLLLRITSSLAVDYSIAYGAAGNDNAGSGLALDSQGDAVVAGFVGEAPPYTVSSGNSTLTTPSMPVTPNGNTTLTNPGFVPSNPRNGMLQTVTGSETYAGIKDILVIKYGQSSSNPSNPPNPPNPLTSILTSYWLEIIIAVIAICLLTAFALKRRRRTIKQTTDTQ